LTTHITGIIITTLITDTTDTMGITDTTGITDIVTTISACPQALEAHLVVGLAEALVQALDGSEHPSIEGATEMVATKPFHEAVMALMKASRNAMAVMDTPIN
jgi:hypothetical protein